jgi:UDP-4-amino-4,6-dideoxy-N-acetyl-beta-L-altrosamine transaminase
VIPYGRQDIAQEDIDSVIEVLNSDFLTQGPVVPKFEDKLCNLTGAKYSIASNSATSALHLACLSLGLGNGDTLWTSPITFVASVNCALHCNANVDFIDVDPNTGLISIEKLKEKLKQAEIKGNLPKIIIPVHFAGQPCNMEEIFILGKKYGFKIIEDAAHALGAKYKGGYVGNCLYSDITVFSFHPVKIVTSGEGGASLTNDPVLASKMRLLRSHGITRDKREMQNPSDASWYYEQIDLGYNFRMTDIHAALGLSQIKRLEEYVERRIELVNLYKDKLSYNGFSSLEQKDNRRSSWHLFIIRIDGAKKLRDELITVLRENEVAVNLHYIPVYKHPYFNQKIFLKGAEDYYDSALTVPLFPKMTINDVEYVSLIINNYFN